MERYQVDIAIESDSSDSDWWEERYRQEGATQWGETPSRTAIKAAKNLKTGGKILVVGYGYGRELLYLCKEGFSVSGIEQSREANRLANESLNKEGCSIKNIVIGKLEEQNNFLPNSFDAILAHRVIHLITDSQILLKWIEMINYLLVPGGKIFISSRNHNDVNAGLVKKVGQNLFLCKGRDHHLIRLWDNQDFIANFKLYCKDFKFEHFREIESDQTGTFCNITLMQATKR